MKSVLLIEDDGVLRANTAELLELSGYVVKTASNGKKGVSAAIECLPDVIICDIMMPELDGYGVLRALAEEESTRDIPFIFLSAKTEYQDVRKGMQEGADDYLTKPFTENELIGAIESRMARSAILKDRDISKTSHATSSVCLRSLQEFILYMKEHGKISQFENGETIYREGIHCTLIYLIISGVVKTHRLDEKGKELITGLYKTNDFFGFSDFTKNESYREQATAIEKTRLTSIPKTELKPILENNPELAFDFIQLFTENLSEVKEQLVEMAYGSVRKRTARTILKFAEKLDQGIDGKLHILRSDLASVAGMATETLIRTLSSFKKEGLIDIKDRNIRIIDAAKLKSIK
ncbi:response regulator [Pareuzebyella sediminis]|uniref:response regulator n=1 Tax=Pareuzebyella sediminis TaxID=2607998 RepID=UPI0011EC57AA|nr:response regulator [Pareuzebyella sediminis]